MSIFAYFAADQSLHCLASVGGPEVRPATGEIEKYGLGEPFTGQAFSNGRAIYLNGDEISNYPNASPDRIRYWSNRLASKKIASLALIPFRGGQEGEGVIRAFNRTTSSGELNLLGFSKESDQIILEHAASLIGLVMQGAWARRQSGEMQILIAELQRPPWNRLSNQVARGAAKIANCPAVAIYEAVNAKSKSAMTLIAQVGFSAVLDEISTLDKSSLSSEVAFTREVLSIDDISRHPQAKNQRVMKQLRLKSGLLVPWRSSNRCGSLAVFSVRQRRFQERTVDLLLALSSALGGTLDLDEAVLQRDKLREVIARISHTLKGPLAGIRTELQHIRRDLEIGHSETAALASLNRARIETERASARVDHQLRLYRGQLDESEVNLQPTRPSDLIFLVTERWQVRAARRGQRFAVYDSIRSAPNILADDLLAEIALDDLIDNAIKYAWRNTVIEIGCRVLEPYLDIQVTDRGLGISSGEIASLTGPGIRGSTRDIEREIEGSGFGLANVKTIMDLHGGHLTFSSESFLDDMNRRQRNEGHIVSATLRFQLARPRSQR
ncbi:sensor histidine kinase [Engelhardtia mirabilis]|uniref:sensor histidine kinase n=1 Tax=Engelhardtia mirabilis TaxID=2528011 RepID=UPI003AF37261